jgi:hypothetical protein
MVPNRSSACSDDCWLTVGNLFDNRRLVMLGSRKLARSNALWPVPILQLTDDC